MLPKPANDTQGFLLWTGGARVFRVYSQDKKSFKDYELRHADLKVQIVDNSAYFYDFSDGAPYIDYAARLKNIHSFN